MKRITAAKADPSRDPIPDTVIEITGAIPQLNYGAGEYDAFYDSQARQIEEALHGALCGGVYDRLLGHMHARKASQLRVRPE